MKGILASWSNWKIILVSFIAFVVCIYMFQSAQSKMGELAGKEVLMIDMRSDYDKTEINEFFASIKSEGREIHRHTTAVVDMIFPFVYGSLFIFLSAFFLKKIAGPESNWMYLALFPILLMLFDFKENLNTLNLLSSYPDFTEEVVSAASKVTGIKSMLTSASMLLPIILGVVWLVRWMINRKTLV